MITIYILVFVFNSKGIQSMKWIIYFSIPLSLVFILIMLLFGIISGTGVSEGVREYLFGMPNQE